MTHFFHIDDQARERAARGKLYFEFLRVPAMSAGIYVLAPGAIDLQKPHREDEMYYVCAVERGCRSVRARRAKMPRCAGSVIFVEAEREHRFYDVTEELELLAFFAPAEQE